MERAQAVIIGGGIIGASIAYHLARKGMKDVVLLEKELFFGKESTAKCAGGIRAQFSTEVNIKLSLESIKHFERFAEEMGADVEFRQVGYLFMSTTPEAWDRSQKAAAFQRSHGVPVELLGPDRIKDLCPELEVSDVLGGNFCALDGLADPHGFHQAYLKAARSLGVTIHVERPVIGFETAGDRVVAVKTSKGDIACDTVIMASGAWTGELGRSLGIDIPIVPVRRQIVTTAPLPWIDPRWPMMVDNGTGLYMHPESGGLLLGMANKAEPAAFNTNVDEAFTMEIVEAAFMRIPRLEEASINAAWAGLYEVTPDHHPILGHLPSFRNAIVAAGFSGHGFMHAPACGGVIAELALGESLSIDIAPLGIERFAAAEGQGQEEVMVI
ncbi:4-methylaminobutanoate oxidase (formaldehyde-forming) [compost metagenome]